MQIENKPLSPALYFVATPIGSARDITLRALDILAAADVLVAEDTRSLRKLMQIHGIALGDRRIWAYHDHSGPESRTQIMAAIQGGASVAYASEAGTPLVADPGFRLGAEALAQGLTVTTAPGACAAIAALTIGGLPTDRFLFAGFAPNSKSARQSWLSDLKQIAATLVIYESPKRLHALVDDICDTLSPTREIAICREVTKKFEEVIKGPANELQQRITGQTLKGEIVVLIDRDRTETPLTSLEDALRQAMTEMSIKDAAGFVSEALGVPKRQAYQLALTLRDAKET